MGTTQQINLGGVVLDHSIPDEAFPGLIGRNVADWLEEYGRGVRFTVRENHEHRQVRCLANLSRILPAPEDDHNDTFAVWGVVTQVDGASAEILFTGRLRPKTRGDRFGHLTV